MEGVPKVSINAGRDPPALQNVLPQGWFFGFSSAFFYFFFWPSTFFFFFFFPIFIFDQFHLFSRRDADGGESRGRWEVEGRRERSEWELLQWKGLRREQESGRRWQHGGG